MKIMFIDDTTSCFLFVLLVMIYVINEDDCDIVIVK